MSLSYSDSSTDIAGELITGATTISEAVVWDSDSSSPSPQEIARRKIESVLQQAEEYRESGTDFPLDGPNALSKQLREIKQILA